MELLTTSAQRAYRTCPRLYSLRYEQGYRPASESEALSLGTLGHRGLEAWWKAAGEVGDTSQSWDAAVAEVEKEADPFRKARALALMWGYHCRWQALEWQGQPIHVIGVESEFRGPLVNPATGAASKTWERAGKLDALVDVGDRVYVVEHKTTSEDIAPGSHYWARLQIDAQVSNYVEGARIMGLQPAGVIYDVLRKPSQKPLLATPVEQRKYTKPTKTEPSRLYAGQREQDEDAEAYYARLTSVIGEQVDAFFARALVVRLEAEEREAAQDYWQTAVQLRDARRLQVWPRNADACVRYGRPCEFFEVCTGVASLDDVTRFRRAERPHEELQQMAGAAEATAAE